MVFEKIKEDTVNSVVSHLNNARHELVLLSRFLIDCDAHYIPTNVNVHELIDKINECIQSAVEL